MPIIDQYIDIRTKGLNNKYKDYYKSLGYIFPEKMCNQTTIRVRVDDLTKGSSAKILVECPICGNAHMTSYINYNRSSDICHSCSARERGKKNIGKANGQWGKRGKKASRYIDGRTSVNEIIRKSHQYNMWRMSVYNRDGFKCQCCEVVGGNLNCHHIESLSSILSYNKIDKNNWRQFYDILFDKNNGITLCKKCHKQLHSINGGCIVAIGENELNNFLHEYEG